MHLTTKQIEILTVIAKGNGPGDPFDLDQILDNLKYQTTKESLQFSIRALIARGLIIKLGITKRRGRQRQVIAATNQGYAIAGVSPTVPVGVEAKADPIMDTPVNINIEDFK